MRLVISDPQDIDRVRPGIVMMRRLPSHTADARQRVSRRRRGVAATELVVALPLLILFSLATVDFGRFAYVAISLDNAVRVGAERGATRSFTDFTYPSWEADVKSRVAEEVADVKEGWLNNLQIQVETSATSDNLVRVRVAADGEFAPIVRWPSFADVLTLHREISIRQFR